MLLNGPLDKHPSREPEPEVDGDLPDRQVIHSSINNGTGYQWIGP